MVAVEPLVLLVLELELDLEAGFADTLLSPSITTFLQLLQKKKRK